MKSLSQIQEQVSLNKFGCSLPEALPQMDFMDIVEFTNDVSHCYARQCCEDLRERIESKAMLLHHCGNTKHSSSISYFQSGADNLQVDKDLIRNVEIITP